MDNSSLINLVKSSIKERFENSNLVDNSLKENYPELNEDRATFVTLNLNGNLRGCIGSLLPRRSLFDDIVSNAKAAAFEDPRFSPITPDEFENIEIEISILSIPTILEYKDSEDLKSKLRVGIDGVILKDGFYQATFLPSVWEQLPTFELFFSHLYQKAGINQNCLENHPEIYIYQAKKIK
jgi:hypothetical protein